MFSFYVPEAHLHEKRVSRKGFTFSRVEEPPAKKKVGPGTRGPSIFVPRPKFCHSNYNAFFRFHGVTSHNTKKAK